MAKDPQHNIKELRQWSQWAYYSNGTVTTAIDSLTSLHSLDYVVVAKPKKHGAKRGGYKAQANKMNSILRSLRYKEVIRDGLFRDAKDGMYVAYMETKTANPAQGSMLSDVDVSNITEINATGVNIVSKSFPLHLAKLH